ncbi:MAG: glycosyltransferase family protein [Candidatus Micrarchaeota archaeon]
MRIIAIIQARMGSTRLPGKVLKIAAGKPLLWHVISRVMKAKSIDGVVVATTTSHQDDGIAALAESTGAGVYRGSENDVLDRYYRASQKFRADAVVRITADCPLSDPLVIDDVVQLFKKSGADYVSNTVKLSYPNGIDVEVFKASCLERAWREAKLSSEREHVTPYLWKHPELFSQKQLVYPGGDCSKYRLTVDNAKDLSLIRRVLSFFKGRDFHTADLIRLLEKNPKLAQINAGTHRNEGYAKSIKEDRVV